MKKDYSPQLPGCRWSDRCRSGPDCLRFLLPSRTASSVASSAASSEAASTSAAAAELTTVEAGKLTMATTLHSLRMR